MRVFLLVAGFLRDLFRSRRMIWELTKKDIRQRYLGSVLGVLWAFIQPTITVLIFWFVFQKSSSTAITSVVRYPISTRMAVRSLSSSGTNSMAWPVGVE